MVKYFKISNGKSKEQKIRVQLINHESSNTPAYGHLFQTKNKKKEKKKY
jgi:hypothetical protein